MVETEHQVPAYVSMVSYDGALGCGYLHSAAAFPCASQFCASSKLKLSCMHGLSQQPAFRAKARNPFRTVVKEHDLHFPLLLAGALQLLI